MCTRLSFPSPENEPGFKLSLDLNYVVEACHGVLPLGLSIWLSCSKKLNIYSAHAQMELSVGHTLHYYSCSNSTHYRALAMFSLSTNVELTSRILISMIKNRPRLSQGSIQHAERASRRSLSRVYGHSFVHRATDRAPSKLVAERIFVPSRQ